MSDKEFEFDKDIFEKGMSLAYSLIISQFEDLKSDIDDVFDEFELPKSDKLIFLEYIFFISSHVQRKAFDKYGEELGTCFFTGFRDSLKELILSGPDQDMYLNLLTQRIGEYGTLYDIDRGYDYFVNKRVPNQICTWLLVKMIKDSPYANNIADPIIEEKFHESINNSILERINSKIDWTQEIG